MLLKDDTVKRRAIFISVLDVCKYYSATFNTFKIEGKYNKGSYYIPMSYSSALVPQTLNFDFYVSKITHL